MNWLTIDWNEIILLLIGAVIGILGSVVTMIIQSTSEKIGRLAVYTKFNCLKNMGHEGWGTFINSEGGLTLLIPAIFEIENTAKRARVV